jgi:hypothetical protein
VCDGKDHELSGEARDYSDGAEPDCAAGNLALVREMSTARTFFSQPSKISMALPRTPVCQPDCGNWMQYPR